jgi:uncharacterized protein
MVTRRAMLGGLAGALAALPALAQDSVPRRPQTWVALQNRVTVRQRFDFSCGAAALATLLTHYHGRQTREEDVIEIFRIRYPTREAWIERAKEGFSFDDIIFAAGKLGFAGQGARVPFETLEKLSGPVIVHLDRDGYQHFAVLRAVIEGRAYTSDPLSGQRTLLADAFQREYTGVSLAIWDRRRPLPRNSPLSTIIDNLSARDAIGTGLKVIPHVHPPY